MGLLVDIAKPFPNQHSARQGDPLEYVSESFRVVTQDFPEGISAILAQLKGQEGLSVQSIRFNAEEFSPTQAVAWLKEQDLKSDSFEEALEKFWSVSVPIAKMDTEQRLAFGWASVVLDANGTPVIDHQEDRIAVGELEKAAYSYVEKSRAASEMHDKMGVAELVESCVITPEKRTAMGLDGNGITGWWVGFRVLDSAVWEKVKRGQLSEFSIGGSARRENA